MAGEIISVVAQASTQSSWVDTPVMRSVSESDAGRLADLLSMQEVQAPAPGQGPAPVADTAPSNNSIGDAILRSMDSAGRSYKAKAGEIDQLMTVDSAKFTTTDLLRIQFQLINASMQVDLISKAISKGTQHIDQLTKLQ
jgi:type III secretion system YscI/HrpB-like protein